MNLALAFRVIVQPLTHIENYLLHYFSLAHCVVLYGLVVAGILLSNTQHDNLKVIRQSFISRLRYSAAAIHVQSSKMVL